MRMHDPTTEQAPVLESPARVRVVRAVPGSGKTWLVAEILRRELAAWDRPGQGAAALSFTNVAGDEIAKALGWSPGHPHFVGTLDAFVFRFIVRPFGWLFDPGLANVRLLAGETYGYLADEEPWFRHHRIAVFGDRSERISLFQFNSVSEQGGVPHYSVRTRKGVILPVPSDQNAYVLRCKRQLWSRSARVSHSDVAYIAAKILAAPSNRWVRNVLAHRFPFLMVDELQDTGYFLGQVVLALAEHPGCRSALVGDPDQAIFEFNGARPELFRDFERIAGAEVFPIPTTRRCPEAVCRVATRLTAEPRTFATTQPWMGLTALVSIEGNPAEHLRRLLSALRRRTGSTVHLVTRANTTVRCLGAREPDDEPPFRSIPLRSLYTGVFSLRAANTKRALAEGTAAIGPFLLGTTAPTPDELEAN
jgi:DNA helicase-2/ATP-dependent DNA helicase PcrA